MTALLCLVGTVLQLRNELLEPLGAFVPELFARGELWRAVTAHFLHGLPAAASPLEAWLPGLSRVPVHLALNVAGLFVLGPLVERPLGGGRTTLVLLAGGLGTIVGIVAAGHHEVIGASGLVAALAGAILALELHHAKELPAEWRIPRRIFLMAVILQFGVLDPLMRAFIAGGAHLGGFAGGYAAGLWLGVPSVDGRRSNARPRRLALAGLFLAGAAALGIVPLGRQDEPALERHAARLLDVPPAPHLFLHENAAAWLLATHAHPTAEGLELAIALAERAVASTARLSPDLLDTLAEALFQAGDRLGAILTIDEAIALAPRERYFREQRRRFTGERDPDDRPPPPGSDRGNGGNRRDGDDRGRDGEVDPHDVEPEGDDPEGEGEGDGEGDESPFDPDMPRITT